MVNLKELYLSLKKELSLVTEDADFEAREILKYLFGVSYSDIVSGKEILNFKAELLEKIVSKRKERYPLQYIFGEWDFYGRNFLVGEGVLIPRADTEVLVEEVLKFLKPIKSPKVIDLCSGSGCIGITVKLEREDSKVWAVENSEKAFNFLTKNCQRLNADVNCIFADALKEDTVSGAYDLIVSNPPYLTKEDMSSLQAEVKFEPFEALYGQDDGLFFYREITKIYAEKLKPKGMIAYEIGEGQEGSVIQILKENSFEFVCQIKDYNGIIRCVTGIKP